MTLQEFKDQLKKDPFSLCNDSPFYVVTASLSGIKLQGNMNGHKMLPIEIRGILIYDKENAWLEGEYADDDTKFSITLT